MAGHRSRKGLAIAMVVLLWCHSDTAQIFIADNDVPGILYAPLPEPRNDTNIMDTTFNLLPLPGSSGIDLIDYDSGNEMVYWNEVGNLQISRIQLDGTNRDVIVTTNSFNVFALDLVNGKIYWTDNNRGYITRANLNGSSEEEIQDYNYKSRIHSILVDPVKGYLLWSTNAQVVKATLKGDNHTVVKSITARAVITEDCADETTRLFYYTFDEILGVTNLDGSGDRTIKVFPAYIGSVYSLSKYGSKLFWAVIETDYTGYPTGISFSVEYDMKLSTRTVHSNTVILKNGTELDINPKWILIKSNVTYNEPVAIQGCPDNIVVNVDDNASNAPSISWTEPVLNSWSSCPRMDFLGTGTNGGNFTLGITELSYNASDAAGNTDVCQFFVIVQRSSVIELPVNCPDLNRTISTDPGQATYTFTPDFGAENVTKSVDGYRYHGGDVSVNLTLGGSPVGSSVSIGTYDVIALIYDDELSKTCTGIYIVKVSELPVDCPNLNRTISTDPDQATYTFNPDFGADNVTKYVDGYIYHGGDVSVNLSLGGSPVGSSVSIGMHDVIALIYDDELNKTCTGIYIVKDTDPPIVTCFNVTLDLDLDSPNTFSGLTNGTTYTYKDASADPNGITYNVSEDDLFPPGYTPVTLLAVDTYNNSDSCLFYVHNTLTELPVDCPNLNRTISTDPDQATYTFNPDFGAENVTKSVDGYRYYGGDVSVNLTLGGSPVGSSVSIGTHDMIALIYDDELSKTCTGIYIVKDTDPPLLTCSHVTLHRDTPNTFSGLTNGTTYTYTDASADPNGVTYNVSEDYLFPQGYTPVTLFAVDAFNNSDSCQFHVQNTLTELPVNCPDLDRTIGTDPKQATYTFSPDFGADDVTKSVDGYRYHGGDVSVNITLGGSPVGSGVSIGTHDVIALIYDDELSKTCTGTYHVQDDESPFIMCSNLTVPFGNVVANYDAVVSDNVDEPSSLRVDFAPKQPGERLDPGVNEISATVTDSAGNINSTVCYIDIQMTELPVEIVQSSVVYDGNTYSLFFRGHLNEGLTSLNFSFYGDVIYDPIVVNGVEQFMPADLSPGVNNIRIEATDGVLSKTIQFVLHVARNQPVNYELTGNMVLARIQGIDAPFTPDLLDDTTTTFKNLALELQENLDKIYQNTPGFIASQVVSFKSGSIIANFILIFNPTSSLTEIEAIDIFRSALTSEAEVTSGSGLFLTSLPAFNIFLPCEDLTCENSGTCIITSDRLGAECRCTDSWSGDRCQISSNSKPTSIAMIVGTTAGVLLFFILILILVLFMLALRNRKVMKNQSSQGPAGPTSMFGTRDYKHGDRRMPLRGIPIFHHEDRSLVLSFCNDKMDMAIFTQYKSREQRSVGRNFNTFTGRAPRQETLQNGYHRRNGIPLRDTYYYSGQMYL